MFLGPHEPTAGRMIVTQFEPELTICATTPPTSTLVMVPKGAPLVMVIVLPPVNGPLLAVRI